MGIIAQLRAVIGIDGVAAFVAGLRRANEALDQTASKAHKTGSAVGGLGSKFGGAMNVFAGNVATNAFSAITGGLVDLAKGSIDASMAMQDLRTSFLALGYSAEQADRKMAWLKQMAIPSQYTMLQLGTAAQMIEGMGLRMEKVLPIIAKLSMGTGRKAEEDLQMLAGMFGRMGQGMAPEQEALTRFGLSKMQLMQAGAKLHMMQGGTISDRGDPASMLDAFARVVERKYGAIFDEVKDTASARISALKDMWEQAMARMGDALLTYLLPYVDKLGTWLRFMTESGILDNLAKAFMSLFGAPGQGANLIVYALATITAYLENLPELFKHALGPVPEILSGIGKGITIIIDAFATAGIAVWNQVINVAKVIHNLWVGFFRAYATAQKWIGSHLPGGLGEGMVKRGDQSLENMQYWPINWAGDLTYRPFNREFAYKDMQQLWDYRNGTGTMTAIDRRRNQLMAQYEAYAKGLTNEPPKDTGTGWTNQFGNLQSPLQSIERNTRATAHNTAKAIDMRRYSLGGGNLGQIGVTPVEFARVHGAHAPVTVRVEGGPMEKALQTLMQNTINQLIRQGVLATG